MRLLTSASIGVLSLLLGIPAVSAQDEKPRQEEPRPEPNRQEEAKPQQKPADEDKREMKQDQNKLPNEKQSKEEKQQQKDESKAAKEAGKQGQMNQAQGNHAQPVNGKSAHIPDKDFKAHFGRQHTVVINRPVIVEGQPRFQYAGYWFVISDPWPGDWAYTDDCYIDYIDGEYFLFDLLHPGARIVLIVVM